MNTLANVIAVELILCCSALLLLTATTAGAAETEAEKWLAAAPPTPEFKAPATRQQWEQRRAEVRAKLGELLGKLPPRPEKLAVKTLSREDRGDYFLEKFEFDNAAGATVPGYLLLPKSGDGKKSPAVLYCHWHGGQYDSGKQELFQTNATPVEPGPALARAGFVVVGIDAYCFGERNGKGPTGPAEKGSGGEMTASKFNLWVGRSLWGMIVRDDLIALDYLCSRPEVDASRVGVTGASMGATRTWWLMALDDRPKAGVAVVCLTRYRDLIQTRALPAHGIYYFVPGMLNHFDTEAVVALIAPRPFLALSGEKDTGSPVEGIRKIEAAVSPVYALYGAEAEANFRSVIYPGLGHEYTPEMWGETMKWMREKLAEGGQ